MTEQSSERAKIVEWLRLVQSGALRADVDRHRFARRLINALTALDEGRTDPLLKPAKRSNSAKTKREISDDALIIAAVDALVKIGISRDDAAQKVADISGMKRNAVIDLRKKVKGTGTKYKGHGPVLDAVTKKMMMTFGLVDRGLPPPDEKTILNNLAMNLSLSSGRPVVYPVP